MSSQKPVALCASIAALLAASIVHASGCARAVDGSTPPASVSQGSDKLDDATPGFDKIHAVIHRGELDMIFEKWIIYERSSDGVLELSGNGKRFPIAESWRLWEFEKAGWVDRDAANEIYVVASYATGMGPDGAKPFRAKIIMQKIAGGWEASAPEILLSADDKSDSEKTDGLKPRPLDPLPNNVQPNAKYDRAYLRVATTEAERQSLTQKISPALGDVEIDFSTERLVTATRMLTSGSIKMRDIKVHKNDKGYDISYTLYRPRIGTADIKFSAIYAVLPNDGLPLNVFERGGKRGGTPKGERINVKSGVINRVRR